MDKGLKDLNRTELLEMLLEMSEEKERLEAELAEARKKDGEKALVMLKAGSIAEASLKLNGVFEQAQEAADQYLASIAKMKEQWENGSYPVLESARDEAEQIIAEARKKADQMLREAMADCEAMKEMTQREVNGYQS